MRCQDNIKENLIKPVLTPNVVTLTEKNFSATLTICAQYLQFLNDGGTFWKRSETPQRRVIPILPNASLGPPPKAKLVIPNITWNDALWDHSCLGFPFRSPTAQAIKEHACSESSFFGGSACIVHAYTPDLPWDVVCNKILGYFCNATLQPRSPYCITADREHTRAHQDT